MPLDNPKIMKVQPHNYFFLHLPLSIVLGPLEFSRCFHLLSNDFIFSFSLEIELNAKVWNSMKHTYYSRYSFASLMIFLTVISCLLASELVLSGEINLEY